MHKHTFRVTLVIASTLATACDGGPAISPSAREVCEAIAECSSSTDVEECVRTAEAQLEDAVGYGCVAEANAANACTMDALVGADAGGCSLDPARCEAEYRAYNGCVAEAGGTHDVSCDVEAGSIRYCVTYLGIANDPMTTCSSVSGSLVEACASTNVAGQCTYDTAGVVFIATYYDPLPDGVTIETFATTCADGGGTWSMP